MRSVQVQTNRPGGLKIAVRQTVTAGVTVLPPQTPLPTHPTPAPQYSGFITNYMDETYMTYTHHRGSPVGAQMWATSLKLSEVRTDKVTD